MTLTTAPARRQSDIHRPNAGRGCAVVWIDGRRASIALMDETGQITTCEIDRGLEPEPSYLEIVIHAIGDRERVVIMGPSSLRLALEREYVAIHHRPDRLIDVEPAGPCETADLVRRLRELAGERGR